MTREDLVAEAAHRICQVRRSHPVRVAIDGVDAAGKTTLANELVGPLERLGRPVIRASIDGFHNPATVRYRRGDTSPEGYVRDSFNRSGLVAPA
jgi:uridine kinase